MSSGERSCVHYSDCKTYNGNCSVNCKEYIDDGETDHDTTGEYNETKR